MPRWMSFDVSPAQAAALPLQSLPAQILVKSNHWKQVEMLK